MAEPLIVELDSSDPELAAAEQQFTATVKAILAKRARTSAQIKIDELEANLRIRLSQFLAAQGPKIADQVVAAVEKHRAATKALEASKPEKVILIRHAEKPDDPNDPHLTAAGHAHAQRLADSIPAKYGVPDLVIAAANDAHSHRCVETAEPLVAKHHIPFEHSIPGDDVVRAAASIRTSPKLPRNSALTRLPRTSAIRGSV